MYRLLLRLYPKSFRNEYGADMASMFERRRRNTPVVLRPFVWLSAVAEVIANAALVHLDVLRQDLHYIARTVKRAPGFAITATAIVALGIGATTAAFSVTDFVLLRPLPFREPERLVKVWERHPGFTEMDMSPGNFRDWKWANTTFESMAAYTGDELNLLATGEPQRIKVGYVESDLFPTLGLQPLIGRSFAASDEGANAASTVILSYQLWQSEFGGDPAVIGRTLRLDNKPVTIIAVMPRTVRFPNSETAAWIPIPFGDPWWADRNNNSLNVVGRLKPHVSIAQAQEEMTLVAAQSHFQYPKENAQVGATVVPLTEEINERSQLMLLALSGAAACLLLIACANLANLLLARALDRRRELAVRAAVGAGRERLVRQLITESLALAIVGGVVGVAVAAIGVPWLTRLVPAGLPLSSEPSIDARVLAFAVVLTVATGLAFGLAPVIATGREGQLSALRDGTRAGGGRREALRSTLVVAEIVATVVMLVCAGLLLRALWRLQGTDPGFKPDGVLTATTPLPMPQYARVSTREAFYNRVLADARRLPGVTNAAFVSFVPMAFRGGIWPVTIAGRGIMRGERASLRYVTPGFFSTMAIPLKRGRDISDADERTKPYVAVVSESFARRYWPNDDPIGQKFNFAFDDREIVGIVGDVRVRGFEQESQPQVYLSYKQVKDGWISFYVPKDLVVRTAQPGAAAGLAPSVRAIVRSIDPKLPVANVRTMTDIVDLETASRSAQLRVLGVFALIAFVLAAIGIHGLLSFVVSQRAQEIGVRVALGAQPRDILAMVAGNGARLGAIGLTLGIAGAYAAARSMEALLAGIKPTDIETFGASAGLVALMLIIGTLLPTIRALRIDPIKAIRTE